MTSREATGSAGGPGSEYKGRYREYDVRQARVAPCKPDTQAVAVDAPMETSTTNRRDFTQHTGVQRQAALKPTDNNLRAEGAQDFSSSYNLNFQGKLGERARPIRHDKEREQLDRFEGEATYKAEYRQWDVQPRERRAVEQWVPSSAKMADTTTNRSDFKQQQLSRRAPVKPVEEMGRSDDPFVGETGYRETYKEHQIEPRVGKAREEWSPPSVRFNHQTTKQSDFVGPYQRKRESCRPDRAAFASNAPFQASTTNRADFQEKPLGQRYVHRQPEYVRPDGDMDMTTTSKSQFRQFQLDGRRQPVEKPGSSHILRGAGPMENRSGYNTDFTEVRSPRRELMKPKATYAPSEGKFQGESTAKSDYVPKSLSPRETYRPTWEPIQSDVPFESSTENRESFIPKTLPPRQQRGQEMYVAPSVPFNATTTNKESFQGEFAPKRSSCKPSNAAAMSEAKFEGTTTFAEDFRKHEVSPRARHQYETYVPPEGVMDLRTCNQENYQDVGRVSRHVITKPGSSHVLRGEGKFTDSSSYNSDFSAPPPQERRRVLPKSDYQPSQDRFDHVPTYKASFTGAFAPRQTNFRPANRPLQNLNAFEDNVPPKAPYQQSQSWRDASPYVPPVSV
ncbi:uncharacterized protein LOC143281916 [Babylonia areolata]|uniref:uncharacterized protein LOC143281916 n=1 Tax=Babylonia areolata TaxID=304850 RepID=UPI003FD2A1AE